MQALLLEQPKAFRFIDIPEPAAPAAGVDPVASGAASAAARFRVATFFARFAALAIELLASWCPP